MPAIRLLALCTVLSGIAASPDLLYAQEERLEQSVARETWRQSPVTEARRQHFIDTVQTLASPAFAGRAPGTHGGQQTAEYLAEQFQRAGLDPETGHDSYLQTVRLTRFRTRAELNVLSPDSPESVPVNNKEFVAWSSQQQSQLSFRGRPVFAGYGIEAPEFEWNDYQGLDASGKTILILTGDPPSKDPGWFDGKSLSRHGRWDHKLALATKHGAAAVILIHDAAAAGYPFSAVANTFGQQRINLSDPDTARKEPPLCIWMSANGAKSVLAGTKTTLAALQLLAMRNDKPAHHELSIELQIAAQNQHQNFTSFNVVGQIQGATRSKTDTAPIALAAHWDHLGPIYDKRSGKATSYFPGAADNASGIAQMLDVARRLAAGPQRKRPIVFLALTAEESGLLGSRQYVRSFGSAKHPHRPIAALNIDIANVFGRAQDVEVIGLGTSSLDTTLDAVARHMQRRISSDYAPSIGRLYRSDQYEFIRHGIPAVWIRGGRKARTFSLSNPIAQIKQYLREGYHQSGDTIRPWWQIDAALEDGNLIAEVLHRLASGSDVPAFATGSPYRDKH